MGMRMWVAVLAVMAGCDGSNDALSGSISVSCAYSMTSPISLSGTATCSNTVGGFGEPTTIVHVQGQGINIELGLTRSNQPPSMAFAVMDIQAPFNACVRGAVGSWVTDDGSKITTHILCPSGLLALTVAASSL